MVHAALTLFTDAPTGMTGNDDLGTMSAWNVLSSIGIFPVQPGYDTWGLSTPVFERVDLTLDRRYYPRGALTVTAPGSSDSDRYIQSALGGRGIVRAYVSGDRNAARSALAVLHGRCRAVRMGDFRRGRAARPQLTADGADILVRTSDAHQPRLGRTPAAHQPHLSHPLRHTSPAPPTRVGT